ncbi:MAG: hypothetical protein KAW92_02105 [Candidatus Cloacimonetes bacterium]|nr:hypothetical protein [Candidatus Cloacimonadota bacterium]
MGTQQVLLIVLAIIIVGAAVAVGITMFGKQSSSANIDALKADLMNIAANSMSFYKTPAGMAGGGSGNPGFGTSYTNYGFNTWLGFPRLPLYYYGSYSNDNGFFVTRQYGSVHEAQIYCLGRAKGQNPSSKPWPFADAPESCRGNVQLILNIYADRNPPYRITVTN